MPRPIGSEPILSALQPTAPALWLAPTSSTTVAYNPGPTGGIFAPLWQKNERPDANGLHPRHGMASADESGAYLAKVQVGSLANPVTLSFVSASSGHKLTDSLGATVAFPAGTHFQDADGAWQVRNLLVVGEVDLNAPTASTTSFSTTIDSTPRDVALTTVANFDETKTSGKIKIWGIDCVFSARDVAGKLLKQVTTVDGKSYSVPVQAPVEQTLWFSRARNFECRHPLADGWVEYQARTSGATPVIPTPGRAQLKLAISAGTAPTSVTVGAVPNTSGGNLAGTGSAYLPAAPASVLVGHDLISYSAKDDATGILSGVSWLTADGNASRSWKVNQCQVTQASGLDPSGNACQFDLSLKSLPAGFPAGPGAATINDGVVLHYEGTSSSPPALVNCTPTAVDAYRCGRNYPDDCPVRNIISSMVLTTMPGWGGFRPRGLKCDWRDVRFLYPDDAPGSGSAITLEAVDSSFTNFVLFGATDDGTHPSLYCSDAVCSNFYWANHPEGKTSRPASHFDYCQAASGFARKGGSLFTGGYFAGNSGNSHMFPNGAASNPAVLDYGLVMDSCLCGAPTGKIGQVSQHTIGCGLRNCIVDKATNEADGGSISYQYANDTLAAAVAPTDTAITVASSSFSSSFPAPSIVTPGLGSAQTLAEGGNLTLVAGSGSVLDSNNGSAALVEGANAAIFDFDSRSGDVLTGTRIRWQKAGSSLAFTAGASLYRTIGSLSDDARLLAVPFFYTARNTGTLTISGVSGLDALPSSLPIGTRIQGSGGHICVAVVNKGNRDENGNLVLGSVA